MWEPKQTPSILVTFHRLAHARLSAGKSGLWASGPLCAVQSNQQVVWTVQTAVMELPTGTLRAKAKRPEVNLNLTSAHSLKWRGGRSQRHDWCMSTVSVVSRLPPLARTMKLHSFSHTHTHTHTHTQPSCCSVLHQINGCWCCNVDFEEPCVCCSLTILIFSPSTDSPVRGRHEGVRLPVDPLGSAGGKRSVCAPCLLWSSMYAVHVCFLITSSCNAFRICFGPVIFLFSAKKSHD